MIYLPDTNVWIAYLNPGQTEAKVRIARHRPEELALCSVVKAELWWGAYHSRCQKANLSLLRTLFGAFHSFPFDDAAAEEYGRLRAALAARGTPIGPNDMLIAAIALAHDLTLVTHNTREFGRVEGLRLEDWT